MINALLEKIVLKKRNTLKLYLIACLFLTANFWVPADNNQVEIINKAINVFKNNQWQIVWPLSYLMMSFLFGLISPIINSIWHFLFYMAGQNKNRSWVITYRFYLVSIIITFIPGLFGNITDIIYYGNEFFDLIKNHNETGEGIFITYGSIVEAVLLIPFLCIGLYILLWGGAFISGAKWWRMIISFIIVPIAFVTILVLAMMLLK